MLYTKQLNFIILLQIVTLLIQLVKQSKFILLCITSLTVLFIQMFSVPPEYLSTAIYYHLQNAHALDEWDYIWYTFFDNYNKTAQQRSVILRSLGASKDIWRLKSYISFYFLLFSPFSILISI